MLLTLHCSHGSRGSEARPSTHPTAPPRPGPRPTAFVRTTLLRRSRRSERRQAAIDPVARRRRRDVNALTAFERFF